MSFAYTPYILPLIAAAVVSVFIAVYAWARRSTAGALELSLMGIAMFVWTVCYALEVAAVNVETKYFWGMIEYFGIVLAPYAWMLFSISYSGRTALLNWRFILVTAVIPVVTLLMVFTNQWHGWVWRDYRMELIDGALFPDISYGVWFWINAAYDYLIILFGVWLLAQALRKKRGLYRGQIAALLVGIFAPWAGNALYLTGNSPIPYLDLTPFAFTVTVVALAWAIFGFRLADIAPLARDLVMDSMREGMVVLDARGNIVDINEAAARMIGVPAASAIGRTAEDVFQSWSHLVERFARALEAKELITVGEGEAQRDYEVRFSPLQDPQGQLVGRVIMLRAMDENAPQPRFANSASLSRDTRPYYRVNMEQDMGARRKPANPFLRRFINFFSPPVKSDLTAPPGFIPAWYLARERIFTIVARLTASAAAVGIAFCFIAVVNPVHQAAGLALLLAGSGALGALRNYNYERRVTAFLFLLYALAFTTFLHSGFSAAGFIFLLGYVVVSAALTSPRGAFRALMLALFTLGVFSILTRFELFVPLSEFAGGSIFVKPMWSIAGVILAFVLSAFIVLTSNVLLLDNLNVAWRKETQALNLLQQERDLLERRVMERTRALAAARDEAVKANAELRKYFRAIEQSGSAVVITDANGNIEYANPRFEQSTGYSVAEALGKNPRILKSGAQSKEYYQSMWETILAGRVWNGEFLNKRKDGSLYWEYATIAPVLDQNGVIANFVAVKEDITKRKIDEENLLRLSQAVEQSGNTVLIMDRNGLIEYVNPKFTEVTGYSPAEALGKAPGVLMNGMDEAFDFRSQDWWRTVSAGQIWRGEFCNRRKDGSIFWESATIAPVFSRSGEIINFVEIKQDITEQKILQEQIQKQNDYLSILHQMTLDLLNRRDVGDLLQAIVDRSAVLLDAPFSELSIERDGFLVVEAFTQNYPGVKGQRFSREEARLSWQAFDTRQPALLDNYSTWEYRRKVQTAETLHAVADFPVLAGERCLGVLSLGRSQPDYAFTPEQVETGILFARLVALALDNANLYSEAMNEIAERKRAEALLQESEARFRQIVENASDIIYRIDLNGNFTYVNPSALNLMGFENERQALGRNYRELALPEYHQRLKDFYERQYLEKIKSAYYEFPAVAMDGQIVWLGQNVQLIMDGETATGFQAVARNITQLKQVQEALALSRDQALDASRFKSQLLSRVSHELRTPLGGILGYAELLQYKAFGTLNENQQNAVNSIIESTHYLTEVVNDLLDQSQLESQSLSLYNEYFKPAELVEKAISPIKALALKKGLDLRVEISPDLPAELYGDVKRLQQILINLAGNAVKFTKTGEIIVRLDRPAPAQWMLAVRDTGAGIPAEEQSNIFEPFRQANNSITRENRGSGLGLAITKQLVEIMGGQISLESEVGKGSLFTIVLPILNAPGE
ncbi:MAG: PAS domain S-box protein [Chloroflexi bacterium]|nr:PAS domain S-box protein [Chloroflexota bacterium]MCA2001618.1 PAS domain S-box protein [Chloroflexota bacterium]